MKNENEIKKATESSPETKVKDKLGEVYDLYDNDASRINDIFRKFESIAYEGSPIIKVIPLELLMEIGRQLHEVDPNLSHSEFQEQVYEIILPLVEIEISNPDLVREARELWNRRHNGSRAQKETTTRENSQRLRQEKKEQIIEDGERVIASELLYYQVKENVIELHILPGMDLSIIAFINDIRNGLKKIAEFVKKNEQISIISGQSWIITEKPELLEKLGFTVRTQEGGVDSIATISREDFLKRYLKD